jgi:hemerythrin-like domain-containing protein
MADDKTKRGAPDSKRLNRSEPYEMAYAKSERASGARKAAASGSARAKPAGTRATKTSSTPASGSRSASPAMKRTNDGARTAAKRPSVRQAPKPPKEEKTAENTAPKTMKEANAIDLLTDDHLEVSVLFKKYEKLAGKEAPAAERKALAQTLCDMLKTHTAIEEEIFYPAARKAGIDEDMLDEADVEHASAKDLIAQLESGSPDDDRYDAKVKVLGEYINHHVVEEHTEMFPKCRRAGMDLIGLRAEMELRKTMLLPAPAEPAAGAKSGKGEPPGLLSKISETLFSKS